MLPSLPGYGFSGEPAELGWDASRTARAWAELMHRLGYTRYVAQGGDVGALVTDLMGRQAVEGLAGYHLNLLTAVLAIGDHLPKESEQERAAAEAVATFRQDGFGYFLEMATRPQTIGYALLDSPVALAAWLLDHDTDSYYKISRAFVDGEPVGDLTRDTIVDNITLYWLTGTAASAARSYWEDGRALAAALASGQPPPPVSVPVGFTTFPGEIWASPRSWVEAVYPDLAYFNEVDKRRPLRRLGGAGALLHRDPSGVPGASVDERLPTHPHASLDGATGWLNSEPLGPAELRGHVVPVMSSSPTPLSALDGASVWLNSEPLTATGLRGRVVLVDFWTYSCVNWLRTLPYVRAWHERYRDPARRRRRARARVRVRARPRQRAPCGHELDIGYPVVIDNQFAVWRAFENHYWPAVYLVDGDGRVRFHHFGEEAYEETERAVQRLLGVDEELVRVDAGGVAEAADWDALGSPETYVGYARGERRTDRRADELALNQWALAGDWSVGEESAVLEAGAGSIAYRFQARDLNLVLTRPARRSASPCASTASRPVTPRP